MLQINMQELIDSYKPLTSSTRVEDFEIPEALTLGNKIVPLPKAFRRKDVHWMIDASGNLVKAAWISQTLGFVLNGHRFSDESIRRSELYKAIEACDQTISRLVKFGVLTDKRGPGAMGFVQANENVPMDSILISARSWEQLCASNKKWRKAREVMCVRFPNLGPSTTTKLKVIIDKEQKFEMKPIPEFTANSLRNIEGIKDLLREVEIENDEEVENDGIIDAFYLNPATLKGSLEGDGDGDCIYLVIEEYGSPIIQKIDLTRRTGEIKQSDIDLMFKKANRTDRTDLTKWLGPYFTDMPIGPATYKIRWRTYLEAKRHKNHAHPMNAAWKKTGPGAIDDIEFVMDIRKGEWTEAQIDAKMKSITTTMQEIKKAGENGDWFAKTVTSAKIQDMPMFVKRFKKLQDYVDLITCQTPK